MKLTQALLLLVLLQIAPVLPAETKSNQTTATSRRWDFFGHYERRLKKISEEVGTLQNVTSRTVVLLGDSITEAHPAREIAGRHVVNMGIGGDQIEMTTGGGVLRRINLVADAQPEHVFLLIGINDFGSSKPIDVAKAQYANLVRTLKVKLPKSRLHIESILPTRGRFAFHLPTVRAMNEYLKDVARENDVDYVDLYSIYADTDGELKEPMTRDGLHLLPDAYGDWIRELEKRIR